jgi:serine/threonine protein kinase
MMRSRRPTKVTLHNFNIQKQIGRGTFGRVYLAELDVNKQLYAIKAIRKDVLIEHD